MDWGLKLRGSEGDVVVIYLCDSDRHVGTCFEVRSVASLGPMPIKLCLSQYGTLWRDCKPGFLCLLYFQCFGVTFPLHIL